MAVGYRFSVLTITIILGVILVSGPLVPMVDFTTTSFTAALADNERSSLNVSSIRVAEDGPKLKPGNYEWQAVLDAPTVTVRVDQVTGSPLLIYELSVTGLSHNIATLVAFNEGDVGRTYNLDIQNSTLRTSDINESSYPAEIRLRIRSGNETTTIYRKNVTVTTEGLNEV